MQDTGAHYSWYPRTPAGPLECIDKPDPSKGGGQAERPVPRGSCAQVPTPLNTVSAFQQPVSAFTALLPLLGLPASPITIPAPSTFHTAARPAKKQFSGVCETLSVRPHWSLMPSCPLQSLPLTGSGICPPRNWKRWLPPGFIPLGAFSPWPSWNPFPGPIPSAPDEALLTLQF